MIKVHVYSSTTGCLSMDFQIVEFPILSGSTRFFPLESFGENPTDDVWVLPGPYVCGSVKSIYYKLNHLVWLVFPSSSLGVCFPVSLV